MIGSPNYIRWSTTRPVELRRRRSPSRRARSPIEDLFESFYTLRGEPYDDAAFDGRSDYQAFILNGIPAGGLFTGAEVPKTAEQQAIWGGTAGAAVRPVLPRGLRHLRQQQPARAAINSDAVAFAVLTYAYSTETVNGVPGKKVPGTFPLPAPAGSEGTFLP